MIELITCKHVDQPKAESQLAARGIQVQAFRAQLHKGILLTFHLRIKAVRDPKAVT